MRINSRAGFPLGRFLAVLPVFMFVLLLGGRSAVAQELFDAPLTDSSRPVLEKVNARLREHRGVRAQFSQTKTLSVLTKPLHAAGEFVFAPELGVLWKQKSPFTQTLAITKNGMTEYLEDGTVQRSPGGQSAVNGFSKMFLALFAGDTTVLEEQFELYFVGTEKSWQIGAKPRSEEVSRFVDRIAISGTASPERVSVWEKNGDRSEIQFENILVGNPTLDSREEQLFH